ncbi:phosphoadenosine phosphosulfate reductase domain-containing protein [Kineobactrum salinum]|uniref:phosphoadenosine phosphosulfate reductase domain-containing protein n=1 Tax=Kineobactrum salinum TaxID=2708301 RepID=UPI0022B2ABAD|nr:phosphoadenosine phosphosulfate reductase family protein [Kineobactrum salinum]
MDFDFDSANASLRHASAAEIVQWALGLDRRTIATTSMGRNAAVMLHLVSEADRSVPTVWVDTGYNLRDTYVVAERLIRDLDLNIHVYSPQMTSERRNAIMGASPRSMKRSAIGNSPTRSSLSPLAARWRSFVRKYG